LATVFFIIFVETLIFMLEYNNLVTPEFFMCEIPVKDGTFNDQRLWVYHRKSLSLIEFLCVTDFQDFQFNGKMERFEHFNGEITEDWFGVFCSKQL
jgi:hypothetical protein